ncbi:MAG TPA: hypothetical protein VFA33_07245 [Bryobacteraceae bacterium]|nr:hypothetical protein [Bryobacteraceae bacterium]
MANETLEIEPGIHELTDAEARTIFENAARHYLHMSGDEFLRAWKEGRFSENGACADPNVAYVSMLIPLAEPR